MPILSLDITNDLSEIIAAGHLGQVGGRHSTARAGPQSNATGPETTRQPFGRRTLTSKYTGLMTYIQHLPLMLVMLIYTWEVVKSLRAPTLSNVHHSPPYELIQYVSAPSKSPGFSASVTMIDMTLKTE